ncbi:putative hydroxymethylpyrimidine transporter CytX [Clostridium pasteurianum]|uniref:Putative hydroxymethylpyrimidine transporter CytX n=1 Tax=Clostridium pasteurianum BC1 TaxID=86416 RepID=R4K6K6_CLOPA|nr:putative hydroxymethylpyrimidine transporter CytX [Clostridium pasteurianum]AGK95280.1 putative hydroxymethylpyrimidine transporter CytX [Clostridium pasteurianum BC1]
MNKIKNSSMFFLWAGAAISIAEIYTGSMIAPLGIKKGLLAIFIGHIIGTLFLAFGGYISFKGNRNAMEKVRDSFGGLGGKIVALLNVLQLIGWSAIMIIQGGRAISGQTKLSLNLCILVVAAAVFLWSYCFSNYTKKVNDISVIILIILCILLFFKMDGSKALSISQNISFTTAIEITIAMPVSWLPLIGDYSKDGSSGKGVFLSSFWGYFVGSVLMYSLGLAIALYTGKDIVEFLSSTGIIAALIVLLATVTTTFIDIYSAVISSKQIYSFKRNNLGIIIYCAVSTALAFIFPMENYQNFLLLIGSIFVPVYTVVFINYILKKRYKGNINIVGGIAAIAGILLYNYFNNNSLGIPTVFTFIAVAIIYVIFKNVKFLGGFEND